MVVEVVMVVMEVVVEVVVDLLSLASAWDFSTAQAVICMTECSVCWWTEWGIPGSRSR